MQRFTVLAYGIAVYVLFLWTILYAIGFVTGLIVPNTLDTSAVVSGWSGWAINIGILCLFAVQHTIMARQGFKARISKVIPAAAERSTFVLFTCLILNLLFFNWQSIPTSIWTVENEALASALTALSGWQFAGFGSCRIGTCGRAG